MMSHTHFTTGGVRRAAAGFSLVEVLVALIVISIGLLGIAKLQAVGAVEHQHRRQACPRRHPGRKSGLLDARRSCLLASGDKTLGCLGPAPASATVTGATVSAASDPRLTAGASCWNARPCTAVNMRHTI